ncbi:hypothetical protein J1N35_037429 [Gossypium stocksii]|uniref:Uncharacterized protein n=1 Tax=Gossypium stocksii TaxID=47602 RepID=A0A9D3UJV1_9ROSI|nr:hypothetical protein J1N35_037429 [Gossypium stocksii]
MHKIAKEELKVDQCWGTCSRARRWALEEINGKVVEKNESRETLCWFFKNLISDLQIGDGIGFTFMTDKQKGLMEEIIELLQRVEHRVGARHLYANWRKENL